MHGCQKWKIHIMIQEWSYTLKHQKYPVYTEYLPFIRFALHPAIFFSKYMVAQWPQTFIKHLTVKNILHKLNTYARGPQFTSFCSTASHFRDSRLSKIWNAPNEPRMTLNIWLSVESNPIYAQLFARFALRWGFFEIIASFSFPLYYRMVKVKFPENLREKSSTQHLKYPKKYFCEGYWYENSLEVWKSSQAIWGRSSSLTLFLSLGPILAKRKKYVIKYEMCEKDAKHMPVPAFR